MPPKEKNLGMKQCISEFLFYDSNDLSMASITPHPSNFYSDLIHPKLTEYPAPMKILRAAGYWSMASIFQSLI